MQRWGERQKPPSRSRAGGSFSCARSRASPLVETHRSSKARATSFKRIRRYVELLRELRRATVMTLRASPSHDLLPLTPLTVRATTRRQTSAAHESEVAAAAAARGGGGAQWGKRGGWRTVRYLRQRRARRRRGDGDGERRGGRWQKAGDGEEEEEVGKGDEAAVEL